MFTAVSVSSWKLMATMYDEFLRIEMQMLVSDGSAMRSPIGSTTALKVSARPIPKARAASR